METKKGTLKFCNSTVFYDYKNIGLNLELRKLRKCVINYFYETIPPSRILVTLGIIDDMILKINDNVVDDRPDKLHDLRENILYMMDSQKLFREEKIEETNNEK